MSEALESRPFIFMYIKWHYGQGLRELFGVAGNFLWFVCNFFSFKLLFKTLFSPWKRLQDGYGGSFDLGKIVETLIFNAIMRTVGFATKTVVLLVGFVSYVLVLVFAFFISTIWLLAPALLLGSLVLAGTFFMI